jgi:hypothetical protein
MISIHQRQKIAAGIDLSGSGVLDKHPQVGLQQSRRVLCALDVAPDPEH